MTRYAIGLRAQLPATDRDAVAVSHIVTAANETAIGVSDDPEDIAARRVDGELVAALGRVAEGDACLGCRVRKRTHTEVAAFLETGVHLRNAVLHLLLRLVVLVAIVIDQRQHDCRQDPDDQNDDQEFDQGEALLAFRSSQSLHDYYSLPTRRIGFSW